MNFEPQNNDLYRTTSVGTFKVSVLALNVLRINKYYEFIEYYLACIILHCFILHTVINLVIRTEDGLTLNRNMFALKKIFVCLKCIKYCACNNEIKLALSSLPH